MAHRAPPYFARDGHETTGPASQPVSRPAVLWLHFESLLSDPKAEVRRVALFLGLDAADDELIDRVVQGSSFGAMRAAACAAEGAEAAAKAAAAAGLVEVPGADAGGAGAPGHRLADHLRKGKVGDWRAHFGPFPEVLQRFEVAVGDAMRGTGLRYELGGGSFLAF